MKKCQDELYLKKCEVDQNSVCDFKTEFIVKDDHAVMTADAYIDERSTRQFIIVISVCWSIITNTFVLYVFSDYFF